MRTTIDAEMAERIRESYGRLGNARAVATELGIGQSTAAKYAPGRGAVDHDTLAALVRAEIRALGLGQHVVEGPPTSPVAAPPKPKGPVVLERTYERVAFVSDVHCPFHDAKALDTTFAYLEDYRPELVILGGDLIDCYSISRFDKAPDRSTSLQDEADAFAPIRDRIDALGCAVHWIDGNHEERIDRLITEKSGLFKLRGLTIPAILEFPKRWVYHKNQTHIKLHNLVVLHGDMKGRGSSAKHAASAMLGKIRTSCLFGHLHRIDTYGECDYENVPSKGFASGHLSDLDQVEYIKSPNWASGFATVDFGRRSGQFRVVQHEIIGGVLVAGAKEYGC